MHPATTSRPLTTRLHSVYRRGRLGSGRPVPLPTTYYAAIDGLRAVAILSVLTFHTGLYANGLFGVDVFFVLSGFLITLTLLREHHRTGAIRLGTFYARRAKRLLPVLLLVLGLALWAVLVFGDPATRERFVQQGLASLVYLTNWEQILAGQAYWEGFGGINPLGHMWSLAITEQFYLLWPILLFAVFLIGPRPSSGQDFRFQRTTRRAAIVMWIAIAGFLFASVQPLLRFDGTNSDRMYLGTDTHMMGLLAGAAAAGVHFLWVQRRALLVDLGGVPRTAGFWQRIAITATSFASFASIVLLSLNAHSYEQAWLYRWGFAAVGALTAMLILTLTSPANLLGRALRFPALVGIGKVSYTLFLVHLPIYWLITAIEPASTPLDLLILGVPFSLLAAGALHHLFAEPMRLRSWKKSGTVVFTAWMAATIAAFVVLPSYVQHQGAGTGQTSVLTLGDSLANDFASALGDVAGDELTVHDGGLAGCGVSGATAMRTAVGITQDAPKGCNPWEQRWQSELDRVQPDVVLVNVAWDAVQTEIDGRWGDLTDASRAEAYRGELRRMLRVAGSTGAQVVVADARLHNAIMTVPQASAFNALLDEALSTNSGVRKLRLQDQVCTAGACTTRTETGEKMYLDDRVHFSSAGKTQIAPWLKSQMLRAAG